MQFGYFTMPSHPPERPLKAGHEWDLRSSAGSTTGIQRMLDR